MDAWNEVRFKAQLEEIACRREAMKVANRECKLRNEYPKFTQDDFEGLAGEARGIENRVVENG